MTGEPHAEPTADDPTAGRAAETEHRADWPARRLVREADVLAEEFAGTFSREDVFRAVQTAADTFRDARYVEYVPIFARRMARSWLEAAAADAMRSPPEPRP